MLTSDELYKMKHCIGLDWKKPKRGVYDVWIAVHRIFGNGWMIPIF